MSDWEAIVVVDGPDVATERALATLDDERIRYHVNERRLGGGEARNVGARLATGRWVALLDDDDEWMPQKLDRQLATVEAHEAPAVGFTAIIVRTPQGDYRWPRRAPRPDEHVSDYLFARRGLFAGEGAMHTSSLMVERSLFAAIEFDASLRRFQDTDWVLRLVAAGGSLAYTPEVLSVRYMEEGRRGIRSDHGAAWAVTYDWITRRRHLVTPRAYAAFLLIRGGETTAAARDMGAARRFLRESFRGGKPGPVPLAIFAGKWLVGPGTRRWLRSRLRRFVGRGGTPSVS